MEEVKRGTHRKLGCFISIVGTVIVWGTIGYIIFKYL
jgi:hypothetical protein